MQWTITQLDCYPDHDGEVDVVVIPHWTAYDTQDGFTGSMYGTVALTLDPAAPFIPYDQLTEAQVVSWVQEALGAERLGEIAASIKTQIDNQKNPPIVTPPLPW